ncbi:retinoid-inducible serine carboxypeptidase-like [Liolophura sinensis]|uniref:retinoid-inducible serine carboxypeptidase-like n=1 Tax=Liolophura sinensis TaxID=3198878 RepID=UPI00315957DF
MMLAILLLCGCIGTTGSWSVSSEAKQQWDYVNVRPDAYMFWWLYHTTAPSPHTAPLVMWLQGGPGGSSTGFGNFEEIGPLTVQLKPRNTTWLSEASLLFVDNPVGTGYSYVTNSNAYTTDVKEIAQDLVILFKAFLQRVPEFQTVPFYIFCESYGGKMVAAFSMELRKAIESGEIKSDFRGAALGDSWISPMDSVNTWGPYLYATSLVDRTGLKRIQAAALKTQMLVDAGKWTEATNSWSVTEDIVEQTTNGVNFYNILQWGSAERHTRAPHWGKLSPLERLYHRHVSYMQADNLASLMNGPIRQKLGIIPKNVTWGGQSGMVFTKQSGDFMKPVVDIVESLIQNCSALGSCLDIVVYSGQLDLIVDTAGTEAWVEKLSIAPEFDQGKREPIRDPVSNEQSAYVKQVKNFAFFWILDAGHMVPADNGNTALEMLRMVIHKERNTL